MKFLSLSSYAAHLDFTRERTSFNPPSATRFISNLDMREKQTLFFTSIFVPAFVSKHSQYPRKKTIKNYILWDHCDETILAAMT